jgi:cytochrome c oxidase subunit 1
MGLNRFITVSALLLFASQIIFVVNFVLSWFRGARAGENPWEDNGLEWTLPSPPAHGNFATVPVVHHGPYEFSAPGAAADYLPQSHPPLQVGGGRDER